MNNNNTKDFKVHIYEDELRYMKWLVLQRPDIETGGDLFGLWRDLKTAVVQLVLGPGKHCQRTNISFHQDVAYLAKVGKHLTLSQGLCNIGEWHSHHRIGLASPSTGDADTVWNNMGSVVGGRFLVFIANITGPRNCPVVNIGCFMFSRTTNQMTTGSLVSLSRSSSSSPLRLSLNDTIFKPGTEQGVDWGSFWGDRQKNKRAESTPEFHTDSHAENDQQISIPKAEKKSCDTEIRRHNIRAEDATIKTKLISEDPPRYDTFGNTRGKTKVYKREKENRVHPKVVTKQPERMQGTPLPEFPPPGPKENDTPCFNCCC